MAKIIVRKSVLVRHILAALAAEKKRILTSPDCRAQDGGLLHSCGDTLMAISYIREEIEPFDRISRKKFWKIIDDLHENYVTLDYKVIG